jgi:hypothetical protein
MIVSEINSADPKTMPPFQGLSMLFDNIVIIEEHFAIDLALRLPVSREQKYDQ